MNIDRIFLPSFLLFIVVILAPFSAQSQFVSGKVYEAVDKDTIPLAGAHVFWINTTTGAISKDDGSFELPVKNIADKRIVVSYVGYESDSIRVRIDSDITIVLEKSRSLSAVEVTARTKASYIAHADIKTEVLTQKELERAPCCDLSGCFNNSASVDPAVTNVITDSRELTMLGLSGLYIQVLLDNTPSLFTGLNYDYGISYIPGALIDRISIVKGANSVIQGYESISGIVNVLLKESTNSDRLLLNVFTNSHLEKQFNACYTQTFGEWSTVAAGHSVQRANRIDGDNNSFLDIPLITRYSFYNKWKYSCEEDGIESTSAFKYTAEERIGGQKHFDPVLHRGTDLVYGQMLDAKRFEAYEKAVLNLEDWGKLTLHSAFHTHALDSYFGTTRYQADQTGVHADLYSTIYYGGVHSVITGASYRYRVLDENIEFLLNPHSKTYAGTYSFIESVPGAFAENKLTLFDGRFMVISGIRMDYHNKFGLITTPRLFIRYDADDETTFRGSIGTGFRPVNLFSENSALLASSRDIVFPAKLDPERAMNYGINCIRYFSIGGIPGNISVDLYRTVFSSRISVDFDSDVSSVRFHNLDGQSISNSVLVELNIDPTDRIHGKAAYIFNDVYETHRGVQYELPFTAKNKFLLSLAYESANRDWNVDLSFHHYGRQLLPNTSGYPVEFRLNEYSDPYTMLNVQFTKKWSMIELYAGLENALGTRQMNPIIGAQNPFGTFFEPSFVWGPVRGREYFAGIRFRYN